MPRKAIEARREYMREWRAKNPDKVLANDLRDRERQREYRKAHLAQYAEYARKRRRRLPEEHLFLQAKGRAKKFGVPFAITQADIEWVTHCPVFGLELSYTQNEGTREGWNIRRNSATLDRCDNTKGYVPGNVFVISHHANRLKGDATIEQLEALLRYMKEKPDARIHRSISQDD